MFFPLASRCFFDKLKELGYLKSIPGGDILGYVFASWLVTYTYISERHAISASLTKMISKWAYKTDREEFVMSSWKTYHRMRIGETYGLAK